MSCIFLCTLSSPQLSLSLSDVPFLPFSFTSHPLHGLLPHGPSICQTFFHFCSFSLSSFSLLILYPHSLSSFSLLILSPHSLFSSFSLLILCLFSSFSLLILSLSLLILSPHSLSPYLLSLSLPPSLSFLAFFPHSPNCYSR